MGIAEHVAKRSRWAWTARNVCHICFFYLTLHKIPCQGKPPAFGTSKASRVSVWDFLLGLGDGLPVRLKSNNCVSLEFEVTDLISSLLTTRYNLGFSLQQGTWVEELSLGFCFVIPQAAKSLSRVIKESWTLSQIFFVP